jgi:HIV Tat-specific factor 1
LAGRRFSGIPVEAYISPTRQKFQKTDNRREYLDGAADSADEDEDEEERLERFGDWLEGGNATSK